ncbi:efflux RND transporter permease subunit [Desulfonatronum thioautotrophicum]|uniref:efflux RND transporter permease subunit n=1 Tax=Desulfonatronum thioautotrophicum TaxID=617001 RepID=UPI0005EB2936|nr:efflux RND transporter permease subunit [Desulfonatronum thioautotrophicum]
MNLAAFCIQNNRTSLVILVLLAFLGVTTYLNIPRLEDPEFTVRTALVITPFPGASPQRVEELVTDKLEERIREIAEVDYITSQSMSGVSIIQVNIQQRFKDLDPIWQNLRNKVADAAPNLPEGVPPPLVNDEFGDVFGILIALTGDGFTYREMKDKAETVRDQLLRLEDVAKVGIHGIQEERIFVEFSNARLAEFGFSPAQVVQLLHSQNAIQPSGVALVGSERVVIEPTGEFTSLDDLASTTFRLPGRSESIALRDFATITRDYQDPPGPMARFDGERAMILAVSMAQGGKITDLGDRVEERLESLRAGLPVGLDLNILLFQPDFVRTAIDDFMINLALAFVFVVGAMFVFTGLRTGIVAGLVIPMSILTCIALMPLFGVDLQRVSIASFIIALGLLVANGVVVSENILVRLNRGEDRLGAATQAVRELWFPLLTASLTTIFAFMPIPMAQSETGEYTMSLFIVVSLTLLLSWIFSLTMVPLLSFYFQKPRKAEKQTGTDQFPGFWYRKFREMLLFCLRRQLAFVVFALLLTVGGTAAFRLVPTMFFPPNDREMFTIEFWQPFGTDIQVTAERLHELEKHLLRQEGVLSLGAFIGSGGPRWYLSLNPEQNNPNYAFVIVNTRSLDDVSPLIQTARAFLDDRFPDTRHTVRRLELGPPVGAPIQIRISGPEIDDLYRLRDAAIQAIAPIDGISSIHDDWGEWTKKMVVEVNQEQVKRIGLSTQDIALSLQTQISGLTATQFREGDNLVPVVVRAQESFRKDLGNIEGLNVYGFHNGYSVPLLQVATTRLTWQPSDIRRRDQARTMTVKVEISGRFAADVLDEVQAAMMDVQRSETWLEAYSVEYGGEVEESAKANASVMAGVPLAMGLLVLVLIVQFNSIRRFLIILLTIPPMMVGISAGLLLTREPFGFMAMLGMISLVGIIVNNAILILDRMEIERSEGKPEQELVVNAVQERLRAIFLTAATTIMGLVPLALLGGDMWRPMANVLIFGLAFSSLFTLILCPVLYAMFFRIRFPRESQETTTAST